MQIERYTDRTKDRELVISGRDTPTSLDLVEEPFDQVPRAVQMRADADRVFAIWFRLNSREVSPGAGGGTRTHTTLPSRDFKSLASTSSATSALVRRSDT